MSQKTRLEYCRNFLSFALRDTGLSVAALTGWCSPIILITHAIPHFFGTQHTRGLVILVHVPHTLNSLLVRDYILIRAAARSVLCIEAYVVFPFNIRQWCQPETNRDVFGILQPKTFICNSSN